MFSRIDRFHRLKFEVPREVRLICKFLSDDSPFPPAQVTLRVIRRGGAPSGPSLGANTASNQALLSGAPPSLAAARFSMPTLCISPLTFIRIACSVPQSASRSYVLAAL